MIKNIVFDVGGVLANPRTGHWFITPNFWNILDKNNIDENLLKKNLKEYLYLHTQEPKSENEEYEMFKKYYFEVLKASNYSELNDDIVSAIAQDCVYNDEKFKFFDDVFNGLMELSKKYDLYIISDGWPSSLRVLKNQGLDKYFKGIVISSMHSSSKRDDLFDKFLSEYPSVLPEESLYIDDRTYILDKAKMYGFNLVLMNREGELIETEYKILANMQDIWDIIK